MKTSGFSILKLALVIALLAALGVSAVGASPLSVSGLSVTSTSPTALGGATTFTASIVSGTSVTYSWDFGDGSTASGPDAIVSYTYAAVGAYTVTVTASDTDGTSETVTLTVNVDVPISGLSASNDGPTTLGNATTLAAAITDGTNVSYAWDFGDGTTGSGASAAHTYAAVGNYTASVVASNSLGSSSASTTVSVVDVPISDLAAVNSSPAMVGQTTRFTATISAGSNVSYAWDFGDGTTGSGATTTHKYMAVGDYVATVTASNGAGTASATTAVSIIARVTFTEYSVPTANGQPTGIALGQDGALWFTEFAGNKIGRITTVGVLTEFTLPDNGGPLSITKGPDGAMWFTEYSHGKIGRISLDGTTITEFTIPTANSLPYVIVLGGDRAVWFTEIDANKIGRLDLNGNFTEYNVPTANSGSAFIAVGPDRALWFTEYSAGKIGRLTMSGTFSEYSIPTADSGPMGIITGPDRQIWFTEYNSGKVAKMTTAGTVTEYALPTANSGPLGITYSTDGTMWVTEILAGKIAQVTLTGTVLEYPLANSSSEPTVIVRGPGGVLWFTEQVGNSIGKINR